MLAMLALLAMLATTSLLGYGLVEIENRRRHRRPGRELRGVAAGVGRRLADGNELRRRAAVLREGLEPSAEQAAQHAGFGAGRLPGDRQPEWIGETAGVVFSSLGQGALRQDP